MNFIIGSTLYLSSVAGVVWWTSRYRFQKITAVPINSPKMSTVKSTDQGDATLLDDTESNAYYYWRLGAFLIGISSVHFFAVSCTLARNTNCSISRAACGGLLGCLPTLAYGLYTTKKNSDIIRKIKQQRWRLYNEQFPRGWKTKK